MRKYLLLLVLSLLSWTGGVQLQAQVASSDFEPGVVRVKLQREVASRIAQGAIPMSNGIVTTGVTQFDRVNAKVRAVSMTRLVPYSPKFEARHKAYGLDLWYEVRFEEAGITPLQARNLYKSVPGIQSVENVRPIQAIGGNSFRPVSPEVMAKASAMAALPFNDPLLSSQWHYHNDGSLAGSVAGADANVWKAWDIETGKSDVIVAIIDGGFQTDHPDLKANAWVNEKELNGQPGVDDDGNGYVDDVYGYNFVTMSSDINAHSHGTHVAGTVGAVNNNGIGVAGVAGGSGNGGVKMVVCQVFDTRSNLSANNLAALTYAADMGASIAQCSWGWSSPDYVEQSTIDGIDYFTANGGGEKMRGGLCIFANGNTGTEGNYWPACYDKVLSVGAMTAMLTPASYSTYGDWVDVTAPGGNMDFGEKYGVLSTLPNSTYGYNEGTSMACPHVSGIAALVLSKYGSSDFTNENLRSQLVSSVNDFYTANPSAEGKFGSGYIDAYKALQVGSGAAPASVSDLALTPSQDNILVEWTIPEAEEKSVDHHILYYSTNAFTSGSDLSKLKSVTIDTKFYASGDKMKYEIDGLSPLTAYYVAIKAVNRYGNASALSEVKSATTNAGPEVDIDKTSLTLDVDASASLVGQDQFTINNTGEGLLKYSMSAATAKVPSISQSASTPVSPGRIVPASKSVVAKSLDEHPVVSADYQADDYPVNFTYSRSIAAYVGEGDLSLPNAQAQYFYVDPATYPNGFNLTHINVGGIYGSDAKVEIYDGSSSITNASLLQTLSTSFSNNWNMAVDEQIHFDAGSSFWIVAKFPSGQENPLGAGRMVQGKDVKSYSFYSSDNGKTWTQLSEVLRDGNLAAYADSLTWAITAVSQNPDWSTVLDPQPASGEVRPGESQTVTLKNDGQKMVNGTYTYNLYLNTNESSDSKKKMKVTMKVKGNSPKLVSAKMVDFGDLLVGKEKTLSVEIVNEGYGVFGGKYSVIQGDDIQSSSDQFIVPTSVNNFSARSAGKLDVTFKPTKSGSQSGTITLRSDDGTVYSFIVRGISSMPAKVSVDPVNLDFGDLKVAGEAVTRKFTIKNEGEYPLQYVFPKFSDEAVDYAGFTHRFGYTYESNLDGDTTFVYDADTDLNNEVDITDQFNSYKWQSSAIDLGFKFPFYGKDYDKIYVSSHGAVMMQTKDSNISCLVPEATCVQGFGYVSAFANSGKLSFGADSKISYGRQDGKFTVKFKNVLTGALDGNGAYTPVSFRLSLSADGSVEMFYDDYDPTKVWGSGQNIFVGVSDIECEDPFVVTDLDLVYDSNNLLYQSIHTGSAIRIVAPAKSMISEISSTSGVINIGDSKEITVTAKASDDMYAGPLTNTLTLVTNDPLQPGTNIVLKANVSGEGMKPVAEVESDTVDFGKVFRTSNAVRRVLLSNKGNAALDVQSVTVKNGKFEVAENLKKPFAIAAGTGRDLAFTLPTEAEGAVSDEAVITFGDGQTLVLSLRGTVIGVPQWSVTPSSIEETTPYGVNVRKELKIANTGNEDLEFNIEHSNWLDLTDLTASGRSSVDYVYKSKADYSAVPFEWVDITKDKGVAHQDATYYLDKTDFYTVDLPFEFPFYGKKYKKMYIYDTGFVSFSEHTDYKEFPEPPSSFPTTETFYTNIIAPFWGNHSMGTAEEDGTYYKAEDDHVVVSFINYGNTMMIGMNFQLLLYKDGHYKFQYKLNDDGLMIGLFGLAGMQDETGTRGVRLADQHIESGNAVEFYPVKSFTVAPGSELSVPVELKADSLAGSYSSELTVNTNIPAQPVVKIPLRMNITGEPDAVFPAKVGGEAVADFVNYPMLTYDFEVVNKGSRAFKITNVEFNADYHLQAQLLVYSSFYDDLEGQYMSGYFPWNGQEIIVGKEPVKFQLQYMDMGVPVTVSEPVTFTVEGLDEPTKVVPFELKLTEAPVMAFDKPEIVIDNVEDSYSGTTALEVSNTGKYQLTYSLRLDPNGVDEVSEEGGGGIAPGVMNVYSPALADSLRRELVTRHAAPILPNEKFDGFIYDVPDEDVSNLLYYPILNVSSPSSLMIGTGSDNLDDNFLAATRYTAPEQGFNLTHLYFVGTIGDLENVDIEASVIGSSDVTSDRVIGHGKLRVEKEEPVQGSYFGVPRMLEFDRPVYINPNDTFYVVLKYPAGYAHSAILAQKSERVREGRYMAWLRESGWIDLGTELETQYGSMGYFMTCVEKEPGNPWIKLLDTVREDTVAVGAKKEIKFAINANSTYFDKDNTATLVIKSNDPTQKLVNYHITLNKNAAPAVTVPEGTVSVSEGDTAVVSLTVADSENDAFKVAVSDESGIATVGECMLNDNTPATVADGVVSVPAGKALNLKVELAPDYGTSGLHSFVVKATDARSNARSVTVPYNVEFANRAPVYKGEDEMTVYVGQNTGIVSYETLFTDPDGDYMTFTATMPGNSFAELMTNSGGFIITGKAVGQTKLTLKAVDNAGGETSVSIPVAVSDATGIGSVESGRDVSVYPNPVVDRAHVVLAREAYSVSYRVYDSAGRVVARAYADHQSAGKPQTIDMGQFAPGVYIVRVATSDGEYTVTVAKK